MQIAIQVAVGLPLRCIPISAFFSLTPSAFLLIIAGFDGFLRLPCLVRMAAFASRHDGEDL